MFEFKNTKVHDVQGLAQLLGLHEKTVPTLLGQGVPRGKKLVKKWYVTEEALEAYFREDGKRQERQNSRQKYGNDRTYN